MAAKIGFDKAKATAAVPVLVETLNKKFGDSVSPTACLLGLKKFFSSGVDLKCRSCGWRAPKSKFCTNKCQDTSDGDTCEVFRHLFVVEAK